MVNEACQTMGYVLTRRSCVTCWVITLPFLDTSVRFFY